MLVAQPLEVSGDERSETVAQRRRLLESLAELSSRRSTDALAALREDELVILLPDGDDARELGRACVQLAASLVPDWRLTIGVGGTSESAGAIARSYAQARRALETAQRFHQGNQGDVVVFEDLGLYRLLFQVSDPSELRDFTDQVLGALRSYRGAIVLVTHDEGAVEALNPEKVILLPDGVEDAWSGELADLVALA